MKNKKIVKVFIITLCLTAILSIVVMAKETSVNKKYKCARASVNAIYPHPTGDDFPD